MIRAIIYTRVSTDEQGDNFSLPTQVDGCQRYAAQHGMEVVAQCQDVMSGAKLDRPGLTKVRQIVAAGGCDALVVYSQDRLTRSVAHLLLLRDAFRAGGVAMHAVSRGQSLDTPEGQLFDTIEASFAEFERLKIKERFTRGKRGKLESGNVIGGHAAPYGFQWEGVKREKRMLLHEAEATTVRQIVAWYLGGVGVREICQRLDAAGVPTAAATRATSERHMTGGAGRRDGWAVSSVYHILRSGTYRGEHLSRSYRIAVPIPAIVDAATWAAVQTQMNAGKQHSRRNVKRCYLLRTRLRCVCGGMLVGSAYGETKTYTYYRCSTRTDIGLRTCAAPRKYWPVATLDALVWHWLTSEVLDEQRLREGISQHQVDAAGTRLTLDAERAIYQHQVDAAGARLTKVVQLYAADVLTLAEVSEQKRGIDAARAAALAEVARIDATAAQAGPSASDVDAVCAYAAELSATLEGDVSDALRANIIELLDVQGVLVHDGGAWYLDVTAQLTLDSARLAIDSSLCLPFNSSCRPRPRSAR